MNKKIVGIPQSVVDNAAKVTFLVREYPDHTLAQIIEMLSMPAININTAIWHAQELGYISEPDEETGKVVPLTTPATWEFGEAIKNLEAMLIYSFRQLAKKETDLEEQYLSNWTAGYPPHDVLIALKDLENQGILVQYQIEDGENKYVFFTLAENRGKLWGQKQFKKNPLSNEEPVDTPDVPTEE